MSKQSRVFIKDLPIREYYNVLPFPKGAPTASELYPVGTAAFEEERAILVNLLKHIAAGPPERSWPAHPLFGPMSWREWGVVTYKQVNHHLKQSGA